MQILVVTAHTVWKPFYETDLEIIQRHLDDGHSVIHLHCSAELTACDQNPSHKPGKCLDCIGIRRAGSDLISGDVRRMSILNLTPANKRELASVRKSFSSLADLKRFRVENFDIGYAVLSSIITARRDPNPDLVELADLTSRFIVSALSVYRSLQNYLDRNRVDRVYVFNGRHAPLRAVLRACQSRSIPCFLHELGHDIHHYNLLENATPTDRGYFRDQCLSQWERGRHNPDREAIAERYFLERSKGVVQEWHSFVRGQKEGLLPHSWKAEKNNIVIFNSSDDEFAAIGDEWVHPVFGTQLDTLRKLIQLVEGDPGNKHFYLRMHPNIERMTPRYVSAYYDLRRSFFEVIPPNEAVSTYALMRGADKVLSFSSTTGIEAVFWGTPSILAGRSMSEDLGGLYKPSSFDELIAMLNSDLPAGDRTGALIYGYYQATFGTPFKFFKATGVAQGQFKGQTLSPRHSILERKAFVWKWRATKLRSALLGQPVQKWPGELKSLLVEARGRRTRVRRLPG